MIQPEEAALAGQSLQGHPLQRAALQSRQRQQAAHDASPGCAQLQVHACKNMAELLLSARMMGHTGMVHHL